MTHDRKLREHILIWKKLTSSEQSKVVNYFTQTADGAHVKIPNAAGRLHQGRRRCIDQMNAVSAEHQQYWQRPSALGSLHCLATETTSGISAASIPTCHNSLSSVSSVTAYLVTQLLRAASRACPRSQTEKISWLLVTCLVALTVDLGQSAS